MRWDNRKKIQEITKNRKIKNLVFLFFQHNFYKGKDMEIMIAKLGTERKDFFGKKEKEYLFKHVFINSWNYRIGYSNYERWGQKYTETYRMFW